MSAERELTDLEDLLVGGLDDWNPVGWPVNYALDAGLKSEPVIRSFAIGMITEAIVMGYVVPGDVGDEGFKPWEGDVGDWLLRITSGWGLDSDAGHSAWLNNTAKGDEYAKAALQRRDQDGN